MSFLIIFFILFSLNNSQQQQQCFSDCMTLRYYKCTVCYTKCFLPSKVPSSLSIISCQYQNCGSKPARGKDLQCDSDQLYSLVETSCTQQCCDGPSYDQFTSETFDQCIFKNIELEAHYDTIFDVVFSVIGGVVLIAIVTRAIYVCCRDRNQQQERRNSRELPRADETDGILWQSLGESKESLEKLWDPHKNKQQTCPICLDQFCNCKTQCGHFYHIECLTEWFKKGKICPECRNSQKCYPLRVICQKCRQKFITIKTLSQISELKKMVHETKINCGQCRSVYINNRNESFEGGWT